MAVSRRCDASLIGELFFAISLRYLTVSDHVILLERALKWFKRVSSSNQSINRDKKFQEELRIRIIILNTCNENIPWDLSKLTNEKISNIISSLLDEKKLNLAIEISEKFQCSNESLEKILLSIKIAREKIQSLTELPKEIQSTLEKYFLIQNEENENSFDDKNIKNEFENEDKSLYLIKLLLTITKHGKDLIKQILTQYKISNIIRVPYDRLPHLNHYSTLKILIQQGNQYIDDARDFIELFELNENQITLLLANSFFQSIQRCFGSISRRQSLEGMIAGCVNPFQSVSEFGEFVSMVKEPKFIGDRFLHLYQNEGTISESDSEMESDYSHDSLQYGDWPDPVKTELLVRAHQCYYVSGYNQGTQLVISIVKKYIKVSIFFLQINNLKKFKCKSVAGCNIFSLHFLIPLHQYFIFFIIKLILFISY